ncbi:MipA/OmpV family protein [Oxalobacteraceae bacterium R-40]|uniref:MipA/OmpV family protein n=1 Tax=Keguizhuia sedimenti TaxID=3064264 RepID=A0ABU1BJY6_9BURK|nr:MipA/OmpV family protein [Oxalobacteraceae bacterium R-40]
MISDIHLARSLLSMAALVACPVQAEESKPLWELGVGVGTLHLPDYRGADRSSSYILPVPYAVYRGAHIRADRGSIRGTLFDNENIELNLSLNATLPVNSENNPARAGMPDLKPTVEVGPTADINLWQQAGRKMKLELRLPLRSSVTMESSPRNIGWLFSPGLNLDIRDPAGLAGWNLGILAGTIFTSRKYNEYFYAVDPAYARPDRRAYDPSGGYAGAQFTLAMSKRFVRYWVGGFVRYDNLHGAVFEDSPLVRQRNALWAGVAISWILAESSKRVTVEE